MLKRIAFATVPVADQKRALEFYTKKLGCKVFTDQPMGDSRWIELQLGKAETRIVLFQDPARAGKNEVPALALVADNVQKTYEELRERGVEFEAPPKKEPWGESVLFADSEGNKIHFTGE